MTTEKLKNETKLVMNALLECVKDVNLTVKQRAEYMNDYNDLAIQYLRLSK